MAVAWDALVPWTKCPVRKRARKAVSLALPGSTECRATTEDSGTGRHTRRVWRVPGTTRRLGNTRTAYNAMDWTCGRGCLRPVPLGGWLLSRGRQWRRGPDASHRLGRQVEAAGFGVQEGSFTDA